MSEGGVHGVVVVPDVEHNDIGGFQPLAPVDAACMQRACIYSEMALVGGGYVGMGTRIPGVSRRQLSEPYESIERAI